MRRERPGHTLQTTALLNEAYVRLKPESNPKWESRSHFLAIAACVMRRILIDHARRVQRTRGGAASVPIDEVVLVAPERAAPLLALDEALDRLAQQDARKVQVIELRYFCGLSVEETAEVLRVHPNTVVRDWTMARAWLKRELGPGSEP